MFKAGGKGNEASVIFPAVYWNIPLKIKLNSLGK